jgi:hypothetical protein
VILTAPVEQPASPLIQDTHIRCSACGKLWTEFFATRPWSFRCERCGKINSSPT